MKRPVLLGLLATSIGQQTIAQYQQQYFDGADTVPPWSLFIDLDTATNNVWQVGPPQKALFSSAATFPNVLITDTVLPYPPSDTSSFRFGVMPDQFSWGIMALQWMQKLDLGPDDGAIIEYSPDTGNTWHNAMNDPYVYNFYGFEYENLDTLPDGTYAFSGTDANWRDIWLCFDVSWLTTMDSLMFRFTLRSDTSANTHEGWMIDNMLVHSALVHTIAGAEEPEDMTVEPNPTTGRVDIRARRLDEFHIIEGMTLMDVNGRTVQEFGPSPVKFTVDIGDHPPGTYFLKIRTNLRTETFRILLQRG
jgi:hypothetical protein